MAMLDDAFGVTSSKNKIMLYFNALEDFEIEQVVNAVGLAIKTLKFYPKIAEIRELIEGQIEDRAAIAWYTVIEATKVYGQYNSIRFDDLLIHWIVERMGGWPHFCGLVAEELPFRQKDFIQLYRLGDRNREFLVMPQSVKGLAKNYFDPKINNYRSSQPTLIDFKSLVFKMKDKMKPKELPVLGKSEK